jgi:Flp pilus assembly protein CpaB
VTVGWREGEPEQPAPSRDRRLPRLSLGHVAVALAALLAFVANVALLRSHDDTTAVVVAANVIEAGQVVGADDLSTARVQGEASVMAGLLTSIDGLQGRVARRSLEEGELIGSRDLLSEPAPPGLRAMALPVNPAHAAGGSIRVGDRVDLVDVGQDGVAAYVVRNVPVISVSSGDTGALATAGREYIVIGVDAPAALAVAAAIDDGAVDVIVTTGSGNG